MSSRLIQIRRSGTGLPVPGPAVDPTADAGYQSVIDRNVDFSAVFADAMGHNPDLVLEVPEWDTPPANLEERVWRSLHEVPDPEFPISLVDLGLVYGVAVGDRVKIKEGNFESFEGEVSAVDEASGSVTVMINIFGRSTPVQFDYWHLESV